MKYHIVSGDSPAGSLKYYFKLNNIDDVIINHFDDLSIGPIHIDFLERIKWIKEKLFPWDNKLDLEEISKHILKTYKSYKKYISNFTDNDEIIVWYGDNIIENLMLFRICHEVKKGKIYTINASKNKNEYGYFARAVGECSPENLGKLLSTKILLGNEKQKLFKNNYIKIVNKKSYLRILKNGEVNHVDKNYYDEELLKYIPSNNFIFAGKAIGEVMGNSDQIIGDSFIQYRLKYLIDNHKILTQGKLDNMRTFKIKKK